ALTAGVAGEPVRTRGATLYDRSLVEALIEPPLDVEELPPPLNRGTFIARLRFGPPSPIRFHPADSAEVRRESVSDGWPMTWLTRALLHVMVSNGRPMPLLATCGGFIVVGATIVGAQASSPSTTRLELEPPGAWY